MQVQRIQNNNNYKPNFGLGVEIKGFTESIGQKTINSWKMKGKDIGTDTDLLTLTFGTPFYNLRRKGGPKKCRYIRADINVGGKQYQVKNIVSGQNVRQLHDAMKQHVDNIIDSVNSFSKGLKSSIDL